VHLQPGQAYFTPSVSIGKTKLYAPVYLAFADDQLSGEDWVIVSDEPTTLQTFAQYRLRFQVEESFLDIKSNGFNLEASRLRDKLALTQLIGVIALTMLFLVLQGTQVVTSGQRRRVDPHWKRGMSYLKLGWNWIRLAITQQWNIPLIRFLSSAVDPQPAIASNRQHDAALKRVFTVLSRIPASWFCQSSSDCRANPVDGLLLIFPLFEVLSHRQTGLTEIAFTRYLVEASATVNSEVDSQ